MFLMKTLYPLLSTGKILIVVLVKQVWFHTGNLSWNLFSSARFENDLICPIPGRVAQLVTCLNADTCLTEDPGVASLIPGQSHTLAEIDHEIVSMAIFLPSAASRRVVVSYKRKYVPESTG